VVWPRPRTAPEVAEIPAEVLEAWRFGPDAGATPMPRGSNSAGWRLRRDDRDWILRVALGNAEVASLEAMATAADGLAQGPGVRTKRARRLLGGSSCFVDSHGRGWQCWSWLSGRAVRGTRADAASAGAALRAFHDRLNAAARPDWTAHAPYWPARPDLALLAGDADGRLAALLGTATATQVAETAALAPEPCEASPDFGHGDCHADNLLVLADGTTAIFDLELLGLRRGAQQTDLGVLAHRMARLAAMAVDNPLTAGVGAIEALADAYGAPTGIVADALAAALHESLAKIQACAVTPPPGMDDAGRLTLAMNHTTYATEIITLMKMWRQR
jgi:aminoglycoside phosphotransferase (APT) family kinase protein